MSDENTLTGSEQPATPTPDESGSAAEVEKTEAKATDDTTEQGSADAGATDPDTKSDSEAKDEPKPKPKSRAQERIEQVTRDNRNLRRSVSRLNQEIGKLKAEKPLREEDFNDPAEYQTATFKRATKEAALETQFDGVQSELAELAGKRQEAWADVVAEARQTMPDFETVFDSSVPVSEVMADLIMEGDAPAQLAYWLGKNRHEAKRIAGMSPVEAARALGRLEQRLTAPTPKTVSSAPKPVPTVSGKAHQGGRTPEEMPYEEYKAWRMAKGS
jgi:hypothetical protein